MTGPKSQYARLAAKLRQQLTFLRRSCDAYDAGVEDESIRIANAMRIIFHDKGRSTSLMTHLGLKVTKMLSSSRGLGDWKDFLAHRLDLRSPQPIHMVPLLGDRFIELQLDEWWNNEPVFNHDGVPYSRRMICLSAAEKDGGAHVDEELERYYQVLCAGEYAIGIQGDLQFDGEAPFPQGVTLYSTNAHLALLRQFAHEVLVSSIHYDWLRDRS
jgi:hypothetical protein